MQIVKSILLIGAWSIIGVLIAFMWRIAYFYQKTSGQGVGHYLIAIPAFLLMAGAIWYLFNNLAFIGQPVADVLLFVGGLLLLFFGMRLRELMTGERR